MNGNSMVDAWTMPSRLSQVRNAENRSRQVSGLGTRKWKVNGDRIYDIYIYIFLQWLMVSSCKDLIGTLWGLPKPHGNPTQTLHKPFVFPSVCLGLAWVFDGS